MCALHAGVELGWDGGDRGGEERVNELQARLQVHRRLFTPNAAPIRALLHAYAAPLAHQHVHLNLHMYEHPHCVSEASLDASMIHSPAASALRRLRKLACRIEMTAGISIK